jgi:hypothetical protein
MTSGSTARPCPPAAIGTPRSGASSPTPPPHSSTRAFGLKGTPTCCRLLDQGVRRIGPSFSREVRYVLFALVYLLLRRVVWLIADSSNEPRNTDVELVLLRHQLKVLKHQVGRPRLRRRGREPGLGVGEPAGTQPCGGGRARRNPVHDPRLRHEVLGPIRRGDLLRGGKDRQDPDSGSPSEREPRAVGPHGPDRVPRLDAGARPASPGAGASALRRPLTTDECRIEGLGSRRRTPGPVRLHGQRTVRSFGRATFLAGLSTSTISQLEVAIRSLCALQVVPRPEPDEGTKGTKARERVRAGGGDLHPRGVSATPTPDGGGEERFLVVDVREQNARGRRQPLRARRPFARLSLTPLPR